MTRRELERWGGWLKARRPRPALAEIGADLIVGYLKERGAFKAKSTVSGIVSLLRGAGEWLVREGHWRSNPLRWLRGPKLSPFARVPQRLDRQALKQLWQGVAALPNAFQRHQRLAQLALLYGLGLRRGELERLNVGDWDPAEGLVRVDGRKTGRERRLAGAGFVTRCVEGHLQERRRHLEALHRLDEPALLVNQHGGRLGGPALSAALLRLGRRLKLPLERLHQFRHTCASDLLEAGVRLPEVQKTLGHAALTSTVRYLEIADPLRRAAIARHPLNDWLPGVGAGAGAAMGGAS